MNMNMNISSPYFILFYFIIKPKCWLSFFQHKGGVSLKELELFV